MVQRLGWVLMACLILGPLRLAPAQTPDQKRIASLIEQLASDDFQTREAASKKLAEMGEPAVAALVKAKSSDDPEVSVRATQIVAAIDERICVEQLRLTGHKPNPKFKGYPAGPVTSVSVSADGKRLLTSGYDTTLRLWDTETGKELHLFEGHAAPIIRATLSPDGARALSACWDNSVRLWDATTGKHVQQMSHQNAARSVAFGPRGQALSGGGDGTMKLWNLDSGERANSFVCHPKPDVVPVAVTVAYSEQARLAATCGNDQPIRLWNLESGQEVRAITVERPSASVCFSPDGKRLAASLGAYVCLWDVESSNELLRIDTADSLCAAFSPDGKRLVTGSGSVVQVWDATTGWELRKYAGHADTVVGVTFFPNGQRIASASMDGTARIWGALRAEMLRDETEGK